MKRRIKVIPLLLAVALLLSIMPVAFAAGADPTVTVESGKTVSYELTTDKKGFVSLTYTGSEIVEGGWYMLWIVNKDKDGNPQFTESGILYLNMAESDDVVGDTVTFKTFAPKGSGLTNSDIYISGGVPGGTGFAQETKIAEISVPFRYGDVNDDGTINIVDAMLVAQRSVGIVNEGATYIEAAADVTGDGTVNIVDAMQIAQCSVGIITEDEFSVYK